MGRIPERELERLKHEVDLPRLISSWGVELKKHGQGLVGRCPWHDDRTPSLVVTPSKGLWHCMGACQMGGTAIDWVMKKEKVTFRQAVEILRGNPGMTAMAAPREASATKKAPPLFDSSADHQEMLQAAVRHYHETLKHPRHGRDGLSYLAARGISREEAIEHFKLGYATRANPLSSRLASKSSKEGHLLRQHLIEAGLCRASGHEAMGGSVVFPILGHEGVIKGLYGRKITENLSHGASDHTYLPGPHRGVWNLEAFESAGPSAEIILCESIIDALTFWVNGFRNVTASYGVEGWTEHHWNALRSMRIKRVNIAYDRDEAGDRAAAKLAAELTAEGVECYRVLFPKGMDANAYAGKVKPPAAALKVCLETALVMQGTVKHVKDFETPSSLAAPLHLGCEVPGAALVPPLTVQEAEAHAALQAAAPKPDVTGEWRGEDFFVRLGNEAREYRVRGLKKNLAFEVMKVNVKVAWEGQIHVDTLDLYQAKARAAFVAAAAEELRVKPDAIRQDLGRLLLCLEQEQEAEMRRVLEARGPAKPGAVVLSNDEKAEALAFLKSPDLLLRVLGDFTRLGVVGEESNKLVGYLACVSRKLDDPLAVVIQSTSAAGKSSLMESILALVPEEDRVSYSAMTGQSLFYMGETDLKHKCLSIAEEAGARNAAYALKLLQSEGEVRIASTGKDALTGKLVTHQYRVEGPTMIFLTTTAADVDEELLNRCLVLSVDETRSQTKLIHERQRRAETLEGLLARGDKGTLVKLHQNAQRMLRKLAVVNPYAESLTFLDGRTRMRRDHRKYLTLIRSITLLHQYQREVKTCERAGETIEYVEVQAQDIELANSLCHSVLGRSLDDLSPQARKLLEIIAERVEAACKAEGSELSSYRFTRKSAREWTGWTDFQVHVHLTKLVRLEYVAAYRKASGSCFSYELLLDAAALASNSPVFAGLADPKKLAGQGESGELTQRLLHLTQGLLGGLSPLLGPSLGGLRSPESLDESGNPVEKAASKEKTHGEGPTYAPGLRRKP